MNKKIIILIVSILILVGVATSIFFYFYLKLSAKPKISDTGDIEKEKVIEDSTKGVLPSIENTNPLENKPDLNPVSKTNPYKNIKTNPFE